MCLCLKAMGLGNGNNTVIVGHSSVRLNDGVQLYTLKFRGCSGGAKVLGTLAVPGRPTN